MFDARPKKALSALEQKWEAKLTREGMPAEIRPLTSSSDRDGLKIVPETSKYTYSSDDDRHQGDDWALNENLETFGRETSMADHPTAVFWRQFGQAIHLLPADFSKRDHQFLEALADSGNVNAVRLTFKGMSEPTAYRILKRFAAWRKANKC